MERFYYHRLGAFLNDYQDDAELNHALAYLHRDDEVQTERWTYIITRAIVQAFGGGKQQQVTPEEKVIDTTDPEFAKHFMGFTGPGAQQ